MAIDSLELQLASAVQRYNSLQRRAEQGREPAALLGKTIAELGTALEELRAAQEQLIDSRNHMAQLQQQLQVQAEKYWELFDAMPEPYIVSKPDSTIVEANKAASNLLNVSQRFLIGKPLSVFVCEDRAQFLETGRRAAAERLEVDLTLKVRPRERAPLSLRGKVAGHGDSLRWVLRACHLTPESQDM